MKTIRSMLAICLLFSTTLARADFKYTETSQITGGTLMKMLKYTSVFARGETKKQEKQMFEPTTSTHYLKGNRLRTDHPDGTAQIIDLEGRRIISIDTNKKTYGVATFDEIRAAMQQAQEKMQQQQQAPQKGAPPPDTKITITPTIKITPGTGTRVILDQPTKENKMQMDMAMQGTATGASAPPPGQPNSVTATYSMTVDTYVAPGVSGYLEFGQFYRRMAKEVSWMTLPSNFQMDPRVSVAMSSLQQNSDVIKGFPLLSYTSMTIVAVGMPDASQAGANEQTQQAPPPPPPSTSSSSSGSGFPDSPSAAMMKGLGGLFGKKKKQDDSSAQPNADGSATTAAPPPNPNSDPNALMEMTMQVTSFSESSLDGGLFDVPSGYMQVPMDPTQVLGGGSPQSQGGKR